MQHLETPRALLYLWIAFLFTACNGILPETAPAPQAPKIYGVNWDASVCITSADGTRIKGNLFTPTGGPSGMRHPVIIMPATWSLPEVEYFMQAKEFCRKGYIVLEYNGRGWWGSSGLVNVAGPKDMEDVNAVIDWVLVRTPADPSRIGMAGISYGAGIALLGAAHDDRIATVYAMCGWGDLAAALYPGETAKMLWTKKLLIDVSDITFGQLDQEIYDLFDNLRNHANINEALAYAAERSPAAHAAIINQRKIPIGFSNNLQDHLFPANTILPFFRALTVTKRLDLHPGIHAFTNDCIGALGIPSEIWNDCHAWFDDLFMAVDTGIMERPPISTSITGETNRRYFSDLERETVIDTYYPSARLDLPFSSYYGGLDPWPHDLFLTNTLASGGDSGATLGVPLLSEILEAHTPLKVIMHLPLVSRSHAVTWITNALDRDRVITGIPRVEMSITPSGPRAQLIAYLYDVDPMGNGTLISHGPCTVWDATPGERRSLSWELFFTASKIPRGHRLGLVVDTEEKAYYTAPTDEQFRVTVHYGYSTRLTVPFVR